MKTLLRDAPPPYCPPAQPHIMMAACSPHCPTPLPTTTLHSPIPTQRSRRNLRDRCLFQNDGWTKWEAVQLADELEAKREMVKADWECWKEAGKQQEALDLQINGPFLFEWDDLSEEALRDADRRLRQRWNAYEQTETEMAISSHFVKSNEERTTNPSPHTIVSDSSMTKSLIRGNKGEQGGKRQGQLLVKTWEVVMTVPSPRMRAAQRRRKTTMKEQRQGQNCGLCDNWK